LPSERERALARDQEARARLAGDPVYQIKQRRNPLQVQRRGSGRVTTDAVTSRELDVLRCFSRGLNRQMVAETLGISLQTVMAHTKKARTRLRAKNTTEACCEAIRQGLIP
jgi:DNA-binding NarL/FixJ family response regulator